jgi:hypothetical protein
MIGTMHKVVIVVPWDIWSSWSDLTKYLKSTKMGIILIAKTECQNEVVALELLSLEPSTDLRDK